MQMGPAILILFAIHSLLMANRGDQNEQKVSPSGMTLEVRKPTNSTRTFRGSYWYFADLRNNSSQSFTVAAIKQPEGYQGGGRIFRCDLQVWNSRDKGWRSLWAPKLSAYGSAPEFTNVEIKPNHSEQVCGLLLPLQAGSNGECVRFRMRTPWATGPRQISLISQPFSIGEGHAKLKSPCSP